MRNNKIRLLVISLVMFIVGVVSSKIFVQMAEAQVSAQIPKAWGQLRGGSSQYLYFEDASGAVRIYDCSAKRVIALVQRN